MNQKPVLFLALGCYFATLSGCTSAVPDPIQQPETQGDSRADPKDATPAFLAQVGGSSYEWGANTLSFSKGGAFEFILKLPGVRYFPPRLEANGPAPKESDASCTLRVLGTAKLMKSGLSLAKWLDLKLSGVEVLSSGIYRSDEADPAPSVVCERYAQALMKKGVFSPNVKDLDSDRICLVGLDLEVPYGNDPLATGNYYFNGSLRSSDSLDMPPGNRQYFLKKESSVDVTAVAMAEAAGTYHNPAPYAWQSMEVTLDSRFNELFVTYPGCGTKYAIRVSSVLAKGDSLLLNGSILESSDFTPVVQNGVPVTAEICKRFKSFMDAVPSHGIRFDYWASCDPMTERCQGYKHLYMSFGWQNTLYFDQK